MANPDTPFGMRAVGHLHGLPVREGKYYIADTNNAYFVGSVVKLGGSASPDGVPTVTLVDPTANDDKVLGAISRFEPDPDNPTVDYKPASDTRYCYVWDDPDTIFEIQEDSDGGALAAGNVGENADLTAESGDTSTGLSTMELDSDTHSSSALHLRILGLAKKPNNEIGDHAVWEVVINQHEFKTTTGT